MLSRNVPSRGEQALAVSAAAKSGCQLRCKGPSKAAQDRLAGLEPSDRSGPNPGHQHGTRTCVQASPGSQSLSQLPWHVAHSSPIPCSERQELPAEARDSRLLGLSSANSQTCCQGRSWQQANLVSHSHDEEMSSCDQMNYRIQVVSPKHQTLPDHPLSTATVEGAKPSIKPAGMTARAARHSPAPRQRGQQGRLLPSYKLRTWGSVPIL